MENGQKRRDRFEKQRSGSQSWRFGGSLGHYAATRQGDLCFRGHFDYASLNRPTLWGRSLRSYPRSLTVRCRETPGLNHWPRCVEYTRDFSGANHQTAIRPILRKRRDDCSLNRKSREVGENFSAIKNFPAITSVRRRICWTNYALKVPYGIGWLGNWTRFASFASNRRPTATGWHEARWEGGFFRDRGALFRGPEGEALLSIHGDAEGYASQREAFAIAGIETAADPSGELRYV